MKPESREKGHGEETGQGFKKVRYIRMPELLDKLSIARSGGELMKCLASYKKVDLGFDDPI